MPTLSAHSLCQRHNLKQQLFPQQENFHKSTSQDWSSVQSSLSPALQLQHTNPSGIAIPCKLHLQVLLNKIWFRQHRNSLKILFNLRLRNLLLKSALTIVFLDQHKNFPLTYKDHLFHRVSIWEPELKQLDAISIESMRNSVLVETGVM